jgi:PAS domain S-box-containing protein
MDIFECNEGRASVSHRWLEATLQSIADAIVATDTAGAISWMNAAAQRLTGWTIDDAHCKPIHEVLVIRRRSSGERLECPVARVLRGEAVHGEDALPDDAQLVRRDGTTVSVADSVAATYEPSGTLCGAVMVFRDHTARVRELERLSFLSQASVEMNASLDYEVTLSTVAKLAVPMIADGCAVIMGEDGDVTGLATAHIDPHRADRLQAHFATRRPRGHFRVIERCEPELAPEITETFLEQLDEDCREFVTRELDLKSCIGVPLKRGAKSIGAILLFSCGSGRRFDTSVRGGVCSSSTTTWMR